MTLALLLLALVAIWILRIIHRSPPAQRYEIRGCAKRAAQSVTTHASGMRHYRAKPIEVREGLFRTAIEAPDAVAAWSRIDSSAIISSKDCRSARPALRNSCASSNNGEQRQGDIRIRSVAPAQSIVSGRSICPSTASNHRRSSHCWESSTTAVGEC